MEPEPPVRNVSFIKGKNGHRWSLNPPDRRCRTRQENIVLHLPGPKHEARTLLWYQLMLRPQVVPRQCGDSMDHSSNINERNPYTHMRTILADKHRLHENQMSSDTGMESLIKTTPLNDFWCKIGQEYPILSKMALNVLLPFAPTYLCETGFSTYAATKTKYRNRLDAKPDMRLQLSLIQPDIDQLMKKKEKVSYLT
ncbi:unnamed protein product [Acanthoscelides obtectus]|uniref:HAT C-terminal dimerisation domain-containing protein n=1 Tax=Acanthoscelides obtectus TaxID=200917 RepID=A0A9P0KB41_ACAOB|nr:unnamed protein product [Acanthoscelides obtectus]CAK1657643.1 Zinc finger BED domain-containing protein 5 [Acanthoscelides obtectus]